VTKGISGCHLKIVINSNLSVMNTIRYDRELNNECKAECGHLNLAHWIGLDRAVFYVPPTQYRLYGRWFLQVKRPNQQYQSTEGRN